MIIDSRYLQLIEQFGALLSSAYDLAKEIDNKSTKAACSEIEDLQAKQAQLAAQCHNSLTHTVFTQLEFFTGLQEFITNCSKSGGANRYLVRALKKPQANSATLFDVFSQQFPSHSQNSNPGTKKSNILFENILKAVEHEKSKALAPLLRVNKEYIENFKNYKKQRKKSIKYWLKDLLTFNNNVAVSGTVDNRKNAASKVIKILANWKDVNSYFDILEEIDKRINGPIIEKEGFKFRDFTKGISNQTSLLRRLLIDIQHEIVRAIKNLSLPNDSNSLKAINLVNMSFNQRLIRSFEIYESMRESRGFFKSFFTGKFRVKAKDVIRRVFLMGSFSTKIKDIINPDQKINDFFYIKLIKQRLEKCRDVTDYIKIIKLFTEILNQKSSSLGILNSDSELQRIMKLALNDVVQHVFLLGGTDLKPEENLILNNAIQRLFNIKENKSVLIINATVTDYQAINSELFKLQKQFQDQIAVERTTKEEKLIKIFQLEVMHGLYEEALFHKCFNTNKIQGNYALQNRVQDAVSALTFPLPSPFNKIAPPLVNPILESAVDAIFNRVMNSAEQINNVAHAIAPGQEHLMAIEVAKQIKRYEYQIKLCKSEQDAITLAKCAVEIMVDFLSKSPPIINEIPTANDGEKIKEGAAQLVDSLRTSDKRHGWLRSKKSIAHKDDTNMLWGKTLTVEDLFSAPIVIIDKSATITEPGLLGLEPTKTTRDFHPASELVRKPLSDSEVYITRAIYSKGKKSHLGVGKSKRGFYGYGFIKLPTQTFEPTDIHYLSVKDIQEKIDKGQDIKNKKHEQVRRLQENLTSSATDFFKTPINSQKMNTEHLNSVSQRQVFQSNRN